MGKGMSITSERRREQTTKNEQLIGMSEWREGRIGGFGGRHEVGVSYLLGDGRVGGWRNEIRIRIRIRQINKMVDYAYIPR
ncbi:hypothetical protein EYC80_009618 [Monilinia laxa]|uniref:Uncharacterized protein n=1 Tax=Monilinia laxa TaxID=61186 RepID=A0A5N6JYD5_MONLA|nr:hypothetical protein EYC80_009618 [Monilinia laxa]